MGSQKQLAKLKLIPFTFSDYSKIKEKNVHILGHPGGRDLWQWELGIFNMYFETNLYISASLYGGNSGGSSAQHET